MALQGEEKMSKLTQEQKDTRRALRWCERLFARVAYLEIENKINILMFRAHDNRLKDLTQASAKKTVALTDVFNQIYSRIELAERRLDRIKAPKYRKVK
jgi:DNA polymerase III alpha subunit